MPGLEPALNDFSLLAIEDSDLDESDTISKRRAFLAHYYSRRRLLSNPRRRKVNRRNADTTVKAHDDHLLDGSAEAFPKPGHSVHNRAGAGTAQTSSFNRESEFQAFRIPLDLAPPVIPPPTFQQEAFPPPTTDFLMLRPHPNASLWGFAPCKMYTHLLALTALASLASSLVWAIVKSDVSGGFTMGAYMVALGSMMVLPLQNRHCAACRTCRRR